MWRHRLCEVASGINLRLPSAFNRDVCLLVFLLAVHDSYAFYMQNYAKPSKIEICFALMPYARQSACLTASHKTSEREPLKPKIPGETDSKYQSV